MSNQGHGLLSNFIIGIVYRITYEALIAETAVWPNFYLMNIFFALKGSKLFIISFEFCTLTMPRYQVSVTGPLVLWLK